VRAPRPERRLPLTSRSTNRAAPAAPLNDRRRLADSQLVSGLTTALSGGAIGAGLIFGGTQYGRMQLAWVEVTLHDQVAHERNEQLVGFVVDETQELVEGLKLITEEFNSRGQLASSLCGAALAKRKSDALQRYHDHEWHARLDLARLKAAEGSWHFLFRRVRHRRNGLDLTARGTVEPFLARWREPIARHGLEPVAIFDPTTRSTADALAALPGLELD
jgi:hypothetical protein